MDRAAPALTAPALGALPACRFGRFALQPAERRLFADGKPVSLGARAFDLLVVLVARAGRLVSKNELITLVWSGLVVEENNLQVQISALRKLLGPSALATIPGRGYRFELAVERVGDDAAVDRAGGDAAAEPGAARPTSVTSENPATLPGTVGTGATLPGGAITTERVSTNLPPRLPLLFGRASDVETIKGLLARHLVVTVAGAGGMGKTRVAQAVAGQLAGERAAEFPDGVWWVDLAPVADKAWVAGAVARVLGTALTSERPHTETLAAVLASQRLLLVLDNCEHVADAVADVVDAICAVAPGIRVLTTSQETLKALDEHVYRLGALSLPASDAPSDALSGGAVELFAVRAQAVAPQLLLGPDNAPAIVEICRRLDGIPLAIELAAARVPLLGVEGLRSRLDERFHVLTGGARVVLRRHQTLRATLEWSHGLLTADEQRVFRRLGVFAGSFTLEAAQYVAQDSAIDGWAALDHLGALVDKSLVLAEGDPVPRYRLLETTRAYALERLGEADETAAMLRRHAEALRDRMVAIDAEFLRGTKASLLAEAGAEVDNLRAALAWVDKTPDCAELAIGLVAYSSRVWSATYQLHEGLERGSTVARRLRDDLPPALVARFWAAIASLGLYSTRRDAYDAGMRAVALYRVLDEPRRLYDVLVHTAVMAYRFATVDEMGELIGEAERLFRPEWPPSRRASLEFARARWLDGRGRYEESLAAAERQSSISAANGSELGSLYAMSNVVGAENRLGRHEIALVHARASIARLDEIGGSSGAGHLWLGVMVAEVLLGRTQAAVEAGRTAYHLLLREGDELRTFWGLALCAARNGALADAARIVGYVEGALQRAGVVLPHAQLAGVIEPLWADLRAGLLPDELARLHAEGVAMREEEVVKLALGA